MQRNDYDLHTILDIPNWEPVQDRLAEVTGTAIITVDYTGCRKSGLRHFFEVFLAPLRPRRGQGAMQGNPCYARLFADLTRTPQGAFSCPFGTIHLVSSNPIKASVGAKPSAASAGFSTAAKRATQSPAPRSTGPGNQSMVGRDAATAPPPGAKPLPMPYGQRRLHPPAAGYYHQTTSPAVARRSPCA